MNDQKLNIQQIAYLRVQIRNTINYYQQLKEISDSQQMKRIFQTLCLYHNKVKGKLERELTHKINCEKIFFSKNINSKAKIKPMGFPSSKKELHKICFQSEIDLLDTIKDILENLEEKNRLFEIFKNYEENMTGYLNKLYGMPELTERSSAPKYSTSFFQLPFINYKFHSN